MLKQFIASFKTLVTNLVKNSKSQQVSRAKVVGRGDSDEESDLKVGMYT
jgi:hypothetical protein